MTGCNAVSASAWSAMAIAAMVPVVVFRNCRLVKNIVFSSLTLMNKQIRHLDSFASRWHHLLHACTVGSVGAVSSFEGVKRRREISKGAAKRENNKRAAMTI